MAKSREAFRTISEVADWLDVQTHVLRFWESKFSQVKPVKRAGGRRYYRPEDMELLGGIKKLLHEDGMPIKDAQKLLREKGVKHVSSLSQSIDGEESSPAAEEAPVAEDNVKEESVTSVDSEPLVDEPVDIDDLSTTSDAASEDTDLAQDVEVAETAVTSGDETALEVSHPTGSTEADVSASDMAQGIVEGAAATPIDEPSGVTTSSLEASTDHPDDPAPTPSKADTTVSEADEPGEPSESQTGPAMGDLFSNVETSAPAQPSAPTSVSGDEDVPHPEEEFDESSSAFDALAETATEPKEEADITTALGELHTNETAETTDSVAPTFADASEASSAAPDTAAAGTPTQGDGLQSSGSTHASEFSSEFDHAPATEQTVQDVGSPSSATSEATKSPVQPEPSSSTPSVQNTLAQSHSAEQMPSHENTQDEFLQMFSKQVAMPAENKTRAATLLARLEALHAKAG